jgi:Zn-dependent protease with chaperone function
MDGTRTSFFDVERERSWRIWLLFAVLVAITFAGVWSMFSIGNAAPSCFRHEDSLATLMAGLVALFLGSLGLAWLYWRLSDRVEERLLAAMRLTARPAIATTGGHRTSSMRWLSPAAAPDRAGGCPHDGSNAFAFSDFAGGTIGVGYARAPTRQQLETVVAHEVAHVLAGTAGRSRRRLSRRTPALTGLEGSDVAMRAVAGAELRARRVMLHLVSSSCLWHSRVGAGVGAHHCAVSA